MGLLMERIEQLARRTDCVFDSEAKPPLGGGFYATWKEHGNCRIDRLFYDRREVERRFFGPKSALWGAAAGLCLLLQNADFFRWSKLEYRELESFLRTANGRPAFQGMVELEKAAQKMLSGLKENLLFSHLHSLLGRLGKLSMPWEGRHLRNIQAALELQNLVFAPFCQEFGLNWELFSLEGESFIFKGGPIEEWEKLALGRFIRHVFQKEALKVVAEA